MTKYKLFIRQYDITSNDYKVREEIVETNDIYHEIGKIYSTSITEIKRIDYQEIDETKALKRKIEQLQDELETLNTLNQQNLKYKQILQDRIDKAIKQMQELISDTKGMINDMNYEDQEKKIKVYIEDLLHDIEMYEIQISILKGEENEKNKRN